MKLVLSLLRAISQLEQFLKVQKLLLMRETPAKAIGKKKLKIFIEKIYSLLVTIDFCGKPVIYPAYIRST